MYACAYNYRLSRELSNGTNNDIFEGTSWFIEFAEMRIYETFTLLSLLIKS